MTAKIAYVASYRIQVDKWRVKPDGTRTHAGTVSVIAASKQEAREQAEQADGAAGRILTDAAVKT